MENINGTAKQVKDLSRESRPAGTPLTQSYYHGVCPTPLSGRTLGQILEKAAGQDPNHVTFKVPDYNQELTLGDLLVRSRAVAKGLIAMGLRKGDVVMTTGMADIESVVLFYGTVSIGLVMYQPCMRYPLDRYLPRALKTDPSVLFVGPEVSEKIIEEIQQMWKSPDSGRSDTLKDIIYTDKAPDSFSTYSEFLKQGETVTDEQVNKMSSHVSTEDTAFILATSGSTGEAKLVCQSHCYAVNCSKFTNTRRNPYKTMDVVGVRNPTTDDIQFFLSITQAVYWWKEILLVILSSKVEFYKDDVSCLLESIQEHKMTWYSGYPFELVKMLESPDLHKYDISSLRGVVVSSYMISPEHKRRLQQTFPDTS
ncbi:uncharacterized protein, partial [Argopecten irradians]|uniref:uncharacterized protein n=1 Tax=Argopecten irradians TaxID=31199 RepID=UPI00371DFDC0